ncbi:hypothetical protein D1159_03025 [Pseudoflavonifractor sp. 524-17]|uniref:hypothetical protein n=1 Tax=Pseudoflavonifractor sp. 524-17 TaxID=2304577 RepID=UPI00137A4317|nr:hypothetical protein [Pseudoflavonifractor sp. 524-17]NCE63574.1 hypothetical protein [Pseudoflavonifractor sp. 524-17]
MFRQRGGWNKTHGTAENTPRIDSFDPAISEGGGVLFVCADGINRLIDCDRYTDYGPTPEADREIVELWGKVWSQTLELSRKRNGFGGSQAFFLCPACGERRRYLYLSGGVFLCRKCAQVNYKSQQETRSDSMYFYHKGCDLVEKHLDTWPRVRPDGFSFCEWIPERPRYMHQTTYRRYLRRFAKYQEQHRRRQLKDMARLLRLFK